MSFTFSKNERLSSLKEIDQLFKEGKSITSAPIRLIWLEAGPGADASPAIRVMFAVPKKKFPKAVDRNRIKRLMRECYRLEKNILFEKVREDRSYIMALMYSGNELPDYDAIQKALSHALERWLKKITPSTSDT